MLDSVGLVGRSEPVEVGDLVHVYPYTGERYFVVEDIEHLVPI